MRRTFCLTMHLAPGDVTVLTALARDLKRAHPGCKLFAETSHRELWRHNPHCRPADGVAAAYPNVEHVKVDYGAGIVAHRSETAHFLAWLHRDFARKTGLEVPVTAPRGDIHFGPDEAAPLVEGRYWVLVAGGKTDFETKIWSPARYAAVARALRSAGLGVVQVGARGRTGPRGQWEHVHFPVPDALDLVGRTDLRQMLRLIRDADGVICGVTAAMHMAAALERPCVVVAGAREAWWWEAYVRENRGFGTPPEAVRVPHRFLHSNGRVPRCEAALGRCGCWRRHLSDAHGSPCLDVVDADGGRLPACLDLITTEHVVEAALSYYTDGTLPPIGAARPIAAAIAGAPRVAPVPEAPPPLPRWAGDGAPAAAPPAAAASSPFDDPAVGGRFTVFSLLYGDYPDLHRRHLDALCKTLPPARAELRVLSNALGPASAALVAGLVASGRVAHHDASPENRKKYPAMRAAFRDPRRPIATPYLVWLDDDTLCDRDPAWLEALARAIAAGHPRGQRLFGPLYRYRLAPGQEAWIREAPWYRGVPFPASGVPFASGSLWALAVEAMRRADVPDPRLGHNGGDWAIGEAVRQAGWGVADFSGKKEVVNWSSAPRRGLSEPHPGL